MRLSDIKVKENDKNAIKVLNKTKVYSQKLKNNIVTVKEKSNIKNEESSANEYANSKRYARLFYGSLVCLFIIDKFQNINIVLKKYLLLCYIFIIQIVILCYKYGGDRD